MLQNPKNTTTLETNSNQNSNSSIGISKLLFIIIPNLIPLAGVIFWEWDLANVILLYWLENLVIGFYTLAKMLTAQGDKQRGIGNKIFISCFFTFHYGMFCMGHAAFILAILKAGNATDFFPFKTMIDNDLITKGVITGTAVMLLTQGLDFIQNYLGSAHQKQLTPNDHMFSPYGHIVVIHLAIMASAAAVMFTGQAIGLLILIILGKILLEFIKLKTSSKLKKKLLTQ